MSRLAPRLAAAIATLVLVSPSVAADFGNSFNSGDDALRTGFSDDWSNSDQNDPLSFELGLRYWYSWGAQSFQAGGASLTDKDNAQTVEGQFRVDDASTNYYAKGLVGTSFSISGSSTGGPPGQPTTVTDGHISYAGFDVGDSWLGNQRAKFGPFLGYMYWNDSPNLGRADYSTDGISGNSQENNVEINALRLGVSGKVDMGNYFDLSGELAAVPYAKISGTLGALGFTSFGPPDATVEQASAMSIDGWGYGAMAEAMVGFHPTQNMVVRFGGRAWYLQGKADETYTQNVVDTTTSPASVTSSQAYISTANPWSLFRYGLLTEFTYSF